MITRIAAALVVFALFSWLATKMPNGVMRATVATGLFLVFAGYLAVLARRARPDR